MRKLRDMNNAILLFGGLSDERLVSVASAQNLVSHYPFHSHWFVSPQGQVYEVSMDELRAHSNSFEKEFLPKQVAFANSLEMAIQKERDSVFFLGFHGSDEEDGRLQELFEHHRICFTGSGSEASKTCFEKTLGKDRALKAGLLVAPQITLTGNAPNQADSLIQFFIENHKMVMKPIANGSSVGLHIIVDQKTLDHAIKSLTSSTHSHWMAEKFIEGRELTVGVIDSRGKAIPLSPSEVLLSKGQAFDFKGKYLGRGVTEVTPADLSPKDWSQAQQVAIKAHQALGCVGYSRTDMIFSQDGFYFLETNTLPGLTKASFIPQQLHCSAISMNEFIASQLELARKRYS